MGSVNLAFLVDFNGVKLSFISSILKGFEIIFRVALALLEYHKESLLLLDMEGMLKVSKTYLYRHQVRFRVNDKRNDTKRNVKN